MIYIEQKIKSAVLGLVIIAAVFAGLASAQYTQTPSSTTQTPQTNSQMMTNQSNMMNQTTGGTTNQSSLEKTQTTEKNESQEHESARTEMLENQHEMMNETQQMMNNTNQPMMNQSRAFNFRNHTVIVTVLNESRENEAKPMLKIDEPKEGATISTNMVSIKSNYTFFSVIAHIGNRNVQGQGHLIYFKDITAPTTLGRQITNQTGTTVQSANSIYNWTNLAPGRHKFSVELVNNNNTPLNPPVVATVTVTIQGTTRTNATTTFQNTTSTGGTATVALSAHNLQFNKSDINVPAGSMVTVKFNNMDNGIPHTFSVYTDSSATQTIFKGQPITGPATTTYTFNAPTQPGTYFFRCDVHPTIMTGNFVVT